MKIPFFRRAACVALVVGVWFTPFVSLVRAEDDAALRPHVFVPDEDEDETPGVDFRLSEVKSAAPTNERVPVAPAEKLSGL